MPGLLFFGLRQKNYGFFQLMDPYTTLFQSTLLWLKRSTGYTNTGEVFHSTKHITSYFTSIQLKLVVKFLHYVCHCGVTSPATRAWHIICQRAPKIWPQLNLNTVCWDTLFLQLFWEQLMPVKMLLSYKPQGALGFCSSFIPWAPFQPQTENHSSPVNNPSIL